jgi:hypothetical protein
MGSSWRAWLRLPWCRSVSDDGGDVAVATEISWDDAPSAGDRLHCLFCFSARPTTIHLLDDAAAKFHDAAGAEYSLPRFVPVCEGCERLSGEGQYGVLASLMRVQNPYEDEADTIVATFHRATRESRPIAGPPA